MNAKWIVDSAAGKDSGVLATLIFNSAPTMLSALLCNGDQQNTLKYLHFALSQPDGQYGFKNHRVIRFENTVIGVGCSWHDSLAVDFDQRTLESLHAFFGIEGCADILQRSAELSAQISRPETTQLVIGHLSTASDYQRQGVAKALINFFSNQAINLSKQSVVVDVEKTNTVAMKCYQKLGFTVQSCAKESHYHRLIKSRPDL